MTLVIADSSPLIALVNIDRVYILPRLFGQVTIPPRIAAELADRARPQIVRDFISNPPPWLHVRAPVSVEPIPKIHAGEREAISLAAELMADLLIIDDRDGRKAAIARGINTTRTIAVLEQAASQNLLDLKEAFDRLRRTDFRLSEKVLQEALRRHIRRDEIDREGDRTP